MVGMSNDKLIDNLVIRGLITKPEVEKVFRLVSRKHFYPKSRATINANQRVETPEASAAAINALNLKPGMKFLHFECDSGYVNAVAGFLLGPWGRNVGLGTFEQHGNGRGIPLITEFLNHNILHNSSYCVPVMCYGENVTIKGTLYDCVYCYRDVPDNRIRQFIRLVRIGGSVVLCNQNKLKILTRQRRGWSARNLLRASPGPLSADLPQFRIVLPKTTLRPLLQLSAMKLKVHAFERAIELAILRGIKKPLLLSYIKDNVDGLQTFIESIGMNMSLYKLPTQKKSIISDILEASNVVEHGEEWLPHLGRIDQIPRLNVTGLDHEQELMEKRTYLLRGIYLYSEAVKDKPHSHEINILAPVIDECMEYKTLPVLLNDFVKNVSRDDEP